MQKKCYRIDLDPIRKQLIEEYLITASESPPSFLLPQYEYHKKIRRKYAPKTEETMDYEDCDTRAKLDVDELLAKVIS